MNSKKNKSLNNSKKNSNNKTNLRPMKMNLIDNKIVMMSIMEVINLKTNSHLNRKILKINMSF